MRNTILKLINYRVEPLRDILIYTLKCGLWTKCKDSDLESDLLSVKCKHITFSNPLGIAAGVDKDCEIAKIIDSITGPGLIELGTITMLPQYGNNKPRLFMMPSDNIMINSMGFNNSGVYSFIRAIIKHKTQIRSKIGINIGINKDTITPVEDLCSLLGKLYLLGDYFTINISSPNTPNLRLFQHGVMIDNILNQISEVRQRLIDKYSIYTPIFIKIAPDLESDDIKRIADTLVKYNIDGIVATNTTSNIPTYIRNKYKIFHNAGLSGKLLKEKSNYVISTIYNHTGGELTIIGAGGIFSTEDVIEKIELGASVIQIYTALAIKGFKIIPRIKRELLTEISKRNLNCIQDLVGSKASIYK